MVGTAPRDLVQYYRDESGFASQLDHPLAVRLGYRELSDAFKRLQFTLWSHPMPLLRYEIVPVAAGWQVSCNGTVGPAFSDRNSAVRDTLATAATLIKDRHRVEVRLFAMDGSGTVLEPNDARLFVD